jgi:hypothetical protein
MEIIKNSEIRINNLLDAGDNIYIVNSKTYLDIDNVLVLFGIPINNDWLNYFKFHINMSKNAYWDKNEDFIVGVSNDKFYYSVFGGTSDEPTIDHLFQIEYVHQLQNLYYYYMNFTELEF